MGGPAAMLVTIVFWILGLALALLIGAWLLRAACYVLSLPRPGYSRAIQIVLTAWFANILAGVALGFVFVVIAGTVSNIDFERLKLVANGMGFAAGLLVSAWVYAAMLPTTYGRGLAIYFVQMLLMFLIALSLRMIVGLVAGLAQATAW